MSKEKILEMIAESVISFDEQKIQCLCEKALHKGVPPQEVLMVGINRGLQTVGEKYETGEFFLPELVAAGEIAQKGLDIVKGNMEKGMYKGTIILGTIKGDLHDIGKTIFGSLAMGEGYEVKDLGVDVSPERFVKAIRQEHPRVVGISALLSTPMLNIKDVIKMLKKEKLRDSVKIIVGGPLMTEEFCKEVGADAWTNNAIEGIKILRSMVG